MIDAHEPKRLKDEGPDAQRVLLRAPAPEMPPQLREQVRLRIERRMEPRGFAKKLVRWVMASGITLVAGSALALGVVKVRAWLPRTPEIAAPSSTETMFAPRVYKETSADPAAQDDDAQAPVKTPRRRPRAEPAGAPQLALVEPPVVIPAPAAEPSAKTVAGPRLSFQDLLLEGLAEEPIASTDDPPAGNTRKGPGRFLVKWEGHRNVSLDVVDIRGAGGDGLARITGTVNRTPLSVEIRRGLMIGKIGDEVVNLWLKGEESATGSIAGYPVDFVVQPISNGYLLRGDLPGHSARLEVRKGILRWYPGCENVLALKGAGVYQGTCAQGQSASVVLPPGFRQLPPLARLVTLALVLTERDPVFRHTDPHLFNPVP